MYNDNPEYPGFWDSDFAWWKTNQKVEKSKADLTDQLDIDRQHMAGASVAEIEHEFDAAEGDILDIWDYIENEEVEGNVAA